jgi:S1-C subfamily serine protease
MEGGRNMSRKTRKVLTWIMTIIIIVIALFNLPYQKIKESTHTFFNNIFNFFNNIDRVITTDPNTSYDHHIKNITFYTNNNNHYAVFEFHKIDPENISTMTINNETFDETNFTYEEKTLIVDITSLIGDGEVTTINVTRIYTKNDKEHISTLSTSFNKAINYQIIEQRKKSLVGIRATTSSFFSSSSNWGSGVILTKTEVKKTHWFNEYTMYEYLIVTNSHVVEDSRVFYVYYDNADDEYPKNTGMRRPKESVRLLGHYTKKADLALLVLTTFDGSLVPLDDPQITNFEAVPIEVNNTVFLIGSPVINDVPAFNSYKIGKIINTSKPITLKDSDLCSTGCYSIQSKTYLGEGSSGGGLFDIDGNLIGINFAGNDTHEEAYALPITLLFDALRELVPQAQQTKGSLATSFYLSLV